MASNLQILLASRPVGLPQPNIFKFTRTPIPSLEGGQVLIKNCFLSLDPAMRGWMTDAKSYIPPVQLGEVMRGGTVGVVMESKNTKFQVGQLVQGWGGWQQFIITEGTGFQPLPEELLARGIAPVKFMSVLGGTGLTAYFGLLDIGQPKPGETVLVSTAAGAVGSIVGQIAKLKGCHVVGICGSDEKCEWIRSLGFDAAINYKSGNLYAEIKKQCPKGVDVYFDNVGGEMLDTALRLINKYARIVICGGISGYNQASKGLRNHMSLVVNSARMEGFVVLNYRKRYPEGIDQLSQWILEGKIQSKEDVVVGLENAPMALLKLFNGSNQGKLVVEIAPIDSTATSKL